MKKLVLSVAALLFITPAFAADFFSTEAENTSTEREDTSQTLEERRQAQIQRRQEYLQKIRERYLARYNERNTVANEEVRRYENAQESWEKRRYIRSTEVRGTTQRRYGNDYYSYAQKKWSTLAKDREEEESEKEYVYRNYKDENALQRRVRKLTDKNKWQDEMQDHFRSGYGRYRPTYYRTSDYPQ